MSSLVKPEFGPTLPELVGPRWKAASRALRIAVVVLAALVLAFLVFVRSETTETRTRITIREPVAYNLAYQPDSLGRVTPQGKETLRLVTPEGVRDPARVTVSPAVLPPYEGDDPAYRLPILATGIVSEMRRADPTFILRGEGRARVNAQPGYQIQYQFQRDGKTWYGRRVLLFPDPRDEPRAREGADIDLQAQRGPVVSKVDDVGSNGATKLPYRSFRLGADAP